MKILCQEWSAVGDYSTLFSKTRVDPVAYQEMRDFRNRFALCNLPVLLLMLSIVIIVTAVIIELKNAKRNALTSADDFRWKSV